MIRVIYETARQPRRSGYITQSLLDQHGSREAVLAWLERQDNQDKKS